MFCVIPAVSFNGIIRLCGPAGIQIIISDTIPPPADKKQYRWVSSRLANASLLFQAAPVALVISSDRFQPIAI
jgi:hypothetical protein